MDINLFDFDLPEILIAQTPEKVRDHSRLLVVNKATQTTEDKHFYDILDYLVPGDVLVRNDTKVIPARLLGVKEDTHAHVEVLLLRQLHGDVWECLVGNAKTVKPGVRVDFGFERCLQCLVGIIGAQEVGLAYEERLHVVVRVDEPAGNALRAVTAHLAGGGMKHVNAVNSDL